MRARDVLSGVAAVGLMSIVASSSAPAVATNAHHDDYCLYEQLGTTRTSTLGPQVCVRVDQQAQWVTAVLHPGKEPTPALFVGITQAVQCDGYLEVTLRLEQLVDRAWTAYPDDGQERLQLHFIGNGLGAEGMWVTEPTLSGGEGHLRMDTRRADLPTWDSIRVVRSDDTRVASMGRDVDGGCEVLTGRKGH